MKLDAGVLNTFIQNTLILFYSYYCNSVHLAAASDEHLINDDKVEIYIQSLILRNILLTLLRYAIGLKNHATFSSSQK